MLSMEDVRRVAKDLRMAGIKEAAKQAMTLAEEGVATLMGASRWVTLVLEGRAKYMCLEGRAKYMWR